MMRVRPAQEKVRSSARSCSKAFLEYAIELKTEEDLLAEDQQAAFIKCGLSWRSRLMAPVLQTLKRAHVRVLGWCAAFCLRRAPTG
jgi:hypothetical protein